MTDEIKRTDECDGPEFNRVLSGFLLVDAVLYVFLISLVCVSFVALTKAFSYIKSNRNLDLADFLNTVFIFEVDRKFGTNFTIVNDGDGADICYYKTNLSDLNGANLFGERVCWLFGDERIEYLRNGQSYPLFESQEEFRANFNFDLEQNISSSYRFLSFAREYQDVR